jgi:tellurite resistance protein TerC
MIAAGAALIGRFNWVLYLFGAFLIFTGIKMAFRQSERIHPEHNPVARCFRRLVPVTSDYRGDNFVVLEGGAPGQRRCWWCWYAWRLRTCCLLPIPSLPSSRSHSTHLSFILQTSSRSSVCAHFYFVLAGAMALFHVLKFGLGLVLTFVGVKMLLAHTTWRIDTLSALLVVATVIAASVVASLISRRRKVRNKLDVLPTKPAQSHISR